MSTVWSCNEWDSLEEIIVGNPLGARFPTADPSTQVAEYPGRPLNEIPQGTFSQQIIEETAEDRDTFVSGTGNELGGQWLQTILGDEFRVHFMKDVYYGSHIDSTFAALRPGLLLCNPARVNQDTLPEILKQWEVIYSPPIEGTERFDDDYLNMSIGSRWIEMNLLSINPGLVVVDQHQTALIRLLEKQGIDVIPLQLRHSRMLGGGFHCTTLDIRREGTLERYFD